MSDPTTRKTRSSAIADIDRRLNLSHKERDDLLGNRETLMCNLDPDAPFASSVWLEIDRLDSLLADPTQDARDELGRSIRYAARLSSFLAGKAHHPDLDELLKDLILDIEHLWLIAGEDEQEVQP